MKKETMIIAMLAILSFFFVSPLCLMAEKQNATQQVFKLNNWDIKMIGIDHPKSVKHIDGTLSPKTGLKLTVIKFEITNKGTEKSALEININQLSAIGTDGKTYRVGAQRVFSNDYFPNDLSEAGMVIKEPERVEWLLDNGKNENTLRLEVKPNAKVPFAILFVVPKGKKLQKVKWQGLPDIKVSEIR